MVLYIYGVACLCQMFNKVSVLKLMAETNDLI